MGFFLCMVDKLQHRANPHSFVVEIQRFAISHHTPNKALICTRMMFPHTTRDQLSGPGRIRSKDRACTAAVPSK